MWRCLYLLYIQIGILFICLAKMKNTHFNFTLGRAESFPCSDNGCNFYFPRNSNSVFADYGTIHLEGTSRVGGLPKDGAILFKRAFAWYSDFLGECLMVRTSVYTVDIWTSGGCCLIGWLLYCLYLIYLLLGNSDGWSLYLCIKLTWNNQGIISRGPNIISIFSYTGVFAKYW